MFTRRHRSESQIGGRRLDPLEGSDELGFQREQVLTFVLWWPSDALRCPSRWAEQLRPLSLATSVVCGEPMLVSMCLPPCAFV